MSPVTRGVFFASSAWIVVVLLAVLRADPGQSRRPGAHDNISMFAPSTDCLACHNSLVTPSGEDVSIGAAWRGTMMANAARDPYVHASVRRETIDHALRAGDIEDECASCHLPAAQKIARAAGMKGAVFSHLSSIGPGTPTALDRLARDGVSCTVCHQIAADRLGTRESFNGNFVVAAPLAAGRRRAFGPTDPDAGRRRIMRSVTGFEQEQAGHIRESELCATCHTLVTEALGPDGQVIGSLPEQMNYQEWQHSAFFGEQRSCQSCHMPAAPGPLRIASVLGDYRERLSRHTFAGGNAFVLRLMNRFRAELGVEATSSELEAGARATERQLEHETATVSVERATLAQGVLAVRRRGDERHRAQVSYRIPVTSSLAPHHGARRQGRALFESGRVTETGLIEGNDSDSSSDRFEPHYEQITRSEEVQIYESIMGTPGGAPTTGLLQATQYLKDNRLLPRGFDKRTAAPEIAVHGTAATDEDFTSEGDRVRYRIAVTGAAIVEVELRYQPISYRWAQNLAEYRCARAPEVRRLLQHARAVFIGARRAGIGDRCALRRSRSPPPAFLLASFQLRIHHADKPIGARPAVPAGKSPPGTFAS